MKQITVNTPSGSYAVVSGHGIAARAGALLEPLEPVSGVFLISSPVVWRHWGHLLGKTLQRVHDTKTILFDDRESAKTLAAVERLCRGLAQAGADRRSVIVALGGGVVGDVAGFVAASYMRGIRIVQMPTTLLAQVDSSIGGKTGVNLPEGKNLVGAFHQPRLVITDPQMLKTLPPRQYRAGLYEVIKYGVIGDEILFRFLERRLGEVLRQETAALGWVLERCIRAKAEVVSADERESGLREILNFGHTFAHALEAATRYRTLMHGEAVGWGMIGAARLSVQMNLLKQEDAARIMMLVQRVGRLPKLPALKAESLVEWMRGDKKARNGRLRMVLAERIGAVETVEDVPEEQVKNTLRELVAQGKA
ncbi:MAG: 3-dehydroquinate synthase [Acidobacteria bacterium]|nr:3-dehydroquinate synthase [Acidobacteriota bacterium]MCL5288260.1 3-dehydroquinate synthase [Acidobacteriota bacterium]